jgi:hypothetical protein
MKLLSIRLNLLPEATTTWSGPLKNYLGDGSDWSLNYGTADESRDPMLYIKVPLALTRSAVRDAASNLVVWGGTNPQGGYERIGSLTPEEIQQKRDQILTKEPDSEVRFYPKLTHVGESHITVSMGAELAGALGDSPAEKLRRAKVGGKPLFGPDGSGMKTPYDIDREHPYKVFRAGFYRDDIDTHGPLLLALAVDAPLIYKARLALGLPRVFAAWWEPHATIGYIPRYNVIHKSYVAQHGSRPRGLRR